MRRGGRKHSVGLTLPKSDVGKDIRISAQITKRKRHLKPVYARKLEDYPLAQLCRYEIPRGRKRLP